MTLLFKRRHKTGAKKSGARKTQKSHTEIKIERKKLN